MSFRSTLANYIVGALNFGSQTVVPLVANTALISAPLVLNQTVIEKYDVTNDTEVVNYMDYQKRDFTEKTTIDENTGERVVRNDNALAQSSFEEVSPEVFNNDVAINVKENFVNDSGSNFVAVDMLQTDNSLFKANAKVAATVANAQPVVATAVGNFITTPSVALKHKIVKKAKARKLAANKAVKRNIRKNIAKNIKANIAKAQIAGDQIAKAKGADSALAEITKSSDLAKTLDVLTADTSLKAGAEATANTPNTNDTTAKTDSTVVEAATDIVDGGDYSDVIDAATGSAPLAATESTTGNNTTTSTGSAAAKASSTITLEASHNVPDNGILVGEDITFTMTTGTAPYTITLLSGAGTVDNANMTVTTSENGSFSALIKDANGNAVTMSGMEVYTPRSGMINSSQTWSGYNKITNTTNLSGGITLTIAPGAKILFDNPNGGNTMLNLGSAANEYNSLIAEGTSSSPITFESYTGTVGRIHSNNSGVGDVSFNYVVFNSIGDGTVASISNLRTVSPYSQSIKNSTFNASGQLKVYTLNTSTAIVDNNTFTNSVNAWASLLIQGGTGLRTISNNTIDNGLTVSTAAQNVVIKSNKITGPMGRIHIQNSSRNITIEDNLVFATESSGFALQLNKGTNFTIRNNYFKGGQKVIKYINVNQNGTDDQTSTIIGNIIEGIDGATVDGIGTPGINSVITNNIFIGLLKQAIKIDNKPYSFNLTIRNNTINAFNTINMNAINTANNGNTNDIASFRNNLVYFSTTATPIGLWSSNSTANEITSATNNYYSFAGNIYDSIVGGTVGTNDLGVAANLDLTDVSVNSSNFTSAEVLAGSVDLATEMNRIKDAHKLLSTSDLINAGSALDNADETTVGGTIDIGAMEYTP